MRLPNPLVFVLALAPLLAPSLAQASDELVDARRLFGEAVAAGEKGDWDEAASKYEASLRIKRAPITLYSLGVALREAGHPAAAMRRFRAFLAEPFDDPDAAIYRKAAQDAVKEMAFEVGRLVVTPEPASAHVTVDGRTCGAAPEPCLVEPGMHRVRIEAPGHLAEERRLRVAKGETQSLTIALDEEGTPLWPVILAASGAGVFSAGVALSVVGMQGPAGERDVAMTVTGEVLVGTGLAAGAVGTAVLLLSSTEEEPATSAWTVAPYAQGPVAGIELRF